MSLIIPVIAGLLFQGDSWTILKSAGIIIALLSIYLTVKKENKNGPIYLAILLFVGAGLLDTVLSHIQFKYLESQVAKDYFTTQYF